MQVSVVLLLLFLLLLDSVTMTVRLTQENAQSIKELRGVTLNQSEVTIKQVAQHLDTFVA